MNQTQVAEILKIQQTVYSRYERGFQTIPLEHLITLADFYGVSIDYITERTNVKGLIQKNKEGRFIYKPFFK